jgi:zinc protease
LQEITLKPGAPFIGAYVSHGDLENKVSTVGVDVSVPDNGEQRGLDAALTEVARVTQHGFTQTELDRQKTSALSGLDTYLRGAKDRYSARFVGDYLSNFLYGFVYPSAETTVAIQRQLIPSITLAEVNKESDFWAHPPNNRIVLITAPEQKNGTTPSVDTTALLALFQSVPAKSVAAYVDKTSTGALVDPLPTPGKIVKTTQHPEVGVTEWTLSNGATVLLKPTDFQADQVLFLGSQRGGASLWSDADYPNAAIGPQLIGAGGLGKFSVMDLQRRLTGKQVSVSASVSDIDESVSGSSTKGDLPTMMQLAYLQMTQPRYDSAAMTAQLEQLRNQLANRSADPGSVFGDTVHVTLSQHSPREPIVGPSLLDSVDLRKSIALFKDRFADFSGFTFMFAGAFNIDSLKPLVERYLASLPNLHRNEAPRDLPVFHPPAGVVKKTVAAGKEARTVTILRFTGPYTSTAQHANDMAVMTDILENRLENRLREQLGGTYGVQVSADRKAAPLNSYAITIQFISDPTRREELTKATFAVIDSLKAAGPSADEMQRVIAPTLRERERGRKTNGYWLRLINLRQLGRPFSEALDDKMLTSTTPAQVQAAARQYFNMNEYQQFDWVPAQTGGTTGQ